MLIGMCYPRLQEGVSADSVRPRVQSGAFPGEPFLVGPRWMWRKIVLEGAPCSR